MISAFMIAAAAAASAPPAPVAAIRSETVLRDAEKAATSGRLEQAELMVERLIAQGVRGPQIDRVLADLAFATTNYAEALTRYEALLASEPADAAMLERAGIAALKLGDLNRAASLTERATETEGASWRAWNARGVLADLNRNWVEADADYAEAVRLSPDQPAVLNNQGWSQLLRGDWSGAITTLERAARLHSRSVRTENNLELARAALAVDLPRRRQGESDESWAQRLNDAGVAAEILGDKARAMAAFSRALHASGTWYARAANNLLAVTASK